MTYSEPRMMEIQRLLDDVDDEECDKGSGSGGNDEHDSGMEFEDALVATNYGKFHWLLVLAGGLANASDAIELLCLSILLPAAQCDLEMDSAQKGWLNASVFFGMMIGGYIWGTVGDVYGRKSVLIVSLTVNALSGIISAFMQTFPAFLIMRFLAGVGVGGSIPLVWAYVSEFQPAAHRGRALSIVASFWMIGNVLVAAVALVIIPLDFRLTSPSGFEFSSWRLFLIICALPSLAISIWLQWMPESAMFLLLKGNNEEALVILRNIFAMNTGRLAKDYPIHSLRRLKADPSSDAGPKKPNAVIQVVKQTLQLFSSSLARVSIILLLINFAIQFGYYGLWLWFPELFNRLEQFYDLYPDVESTVCEVVEFHPENSTTINPCDNPDGPVDQKALINTLITSIAPLPTNLWTIYHMDKLGRKFFLVLSMLLSGASVFGIYFVSSSAANLALSCVFGAVSTMGFNSLDCLGTELFPTNLRSTALAVTLLAARIGAICGNIVFGYFVDTVCVVPILMVAFLLSAGGLLGLLLPNTTRTALF